MEFKDPLFRKLFEEMKSIRQSHTSIKGFSGFHELSDLDFYRKRIRKLSQRSLMIWLALAVGGIVFLYHLIMALREGNMQNSSLSFWAGWMFLVHFSIQQLNLRQKLKALRHGQKLLLLCQRAYPHLP